jgi:hypothetical protein
VSGIEQVNSLLRKYNYFDVRVLHLDRTKPKGNRAAAKAFAANAAAL